MRTLLALAIAALTLRPAPVAAREISVDIAGGWTNTGYSSNGPRPALSGPALDVAASAGGPVGSGAVVVGGVGGLFAAPILDETLSGGVSRRFRLLIPHAGVFATHRLGRAPVSLTGRLELAYGWLTGTIFLADRPSTTGTIATGFGGLASVAASYDVALGRDQHLSIGLDVTGGWVGHTDTHLTPLALLAFVGVRWD
jgi:hypothetical protein